MNRVYRGWIFNNVGVSDDGEVEYSASHYSVHGREKIITGTKTAIMAEIDRRAGEPARDCKWLQDEVCVNSSCERCADFPSEYYCNNCELYEEKNGIKQSNEK